jgi:hydroxypyruvate isomerase
MLACMKRRTFLPAAAGGAAAMFNVLPSRAADRKGRINQSVCRWCYGKISVDDLASNAAKMGITSVDLVAESDWPAVKKYGLNLTVVPGPCTITDGLNRKENHDAIEKKMGPMITAAKAAGARSIIVFSGNRRGMSDQEGAENTIIGLNRIKKMGEDTGVLIVMELLNSKVDHKDYMCDHTAWGVQVVKEVNSPQVKLLYDIYHMQIMEGDVIRTIRDNHQYIGHYHTGGVPGRNELDKTQELYYPAVCEAIIATGFKGHMAHEFIPKYPDPLKSLNDAVVLCDV